MMQEATQAVVPYFTVERIAYLIAAATYAVIQIRQGWAIKETRQELKQNTEATAATLIKTNVIEAHVNGDKSKLEAAAASKDREIELLKAQLAAKTQQEILQAQALAQVVRQRQSDPNAPQNRRAEDKA